MRVHYRVVGITCLGYLLSPVLTALALAFLRVDGPNRVFLAPLSLVVVCIWATSTIWIARRAGHRWITSTLAHVCAALMLAGFIPFSIYDYTFQTGPDEWGRWVPWDLWEGVRAGLAATLGPPVIAALPSVALGFLARRGFGTIDTNDPHLLRLTARRRPPEW